MQSLSEKSFAIDASYSNFYTGGDLAWSCDGAQLFCYNSKEITVVDVTTGQVQRVYSLIEKNTVTNSTTDGIDVDEDVMFTFALSTNNEHLVTAHRSGLLRLWSVETGKVVKLWKGLHKGPIVKVQFSPCCKLMCSSGADSTLRVWDFVQQRCVAVLREHSGPAQVMCFNPDLTKREIYAVGADNVIYCWNYESKQLLHQLRGHLSYVTALSVRNHKGSKTNDGDLLVSVGRDKVLIIWDLSDGKQVKIVPLYEELEGVVWLPTRKSSESDLLVTSGCGTLRLVHSHSAKISPLMDIANCEVKQLLYCEKSNALAVATAEQNILVYERQPENELKCVKQIVGHNDEILDLCILGSKDRFLAVATNSKNIKVYDTSDAMNCKLFAGHKDTVITLSSAAGANSNLMLSSGKDASILLWQLQVTNQDADEPSEGNDFNLVCVGKKSNCHTLTIGSLAFGFNSAKIFASVCQDGSMKMWNLKQDKKTKEYTFELRYAVIAHDKEVNCVAFSPNNKLVATASQDKSVKLWSSETQATVATLSGHTRGVWCVRFSPVDQIVSTSSADCSIRLWSLSTFACLKRFEQECSILRVEFVEHGKYIIAAGSDGLLKTWSIKSGVCMQTLDEHNDRIWSLAVSQHTHKYFYSGGADSKLVRWQDTTKEVHNAKIDQRQAQLLQEQNLQLLLHNKKHAQKALAMALQLGKPKVSYDILKQFVRERNQTGLATAIQQLNDEQRATLFDHVKVWNTNSRHAQVANLVLQHLLGQVLVNPGQKLHNTQHVVEALTPYEQRHFKRLTEMQKDIAFLEFLVKCM